MLGSKTWCVIPGCLGLMLAVAVAGPNDKPGPSGAGADVAAYVGGEPVSVQELDAKILKSNMKLAQSLYDARRAAVDEIILDKLLGPEASAKGVAVADLLKQRMAERAAPVTDAEVEAFYNSNKARMGGKPLEQSADQIKNYLASQREIETRNVILTELKAKTDVRIVLAVPRVEVAVAANDPVKGPANAKVTVVLFSEFQ